MNSIPGSGFNTPGFTLFDPNQFGQREFPQKNHFAQSSISQTSQYERITAADRLQKDITLETAEGDTVTISYQKNTAFLAEKYNAVYQKNSLQQNDRGILQEQLRAQVYSEFFAYSQEEQFSLAITGDLNEDEQRDIREALERIDKLMLETMSGGDIFAGAPEATGIIDLENISAVEADYRYRSLITIEEVAQANSITNYTGDRVPSASAATSPSSPMDRLQELIDKMAQIVEEQISEKKLPAAMFKRPVEQLFADHIARLHEVEGDGPQPSLIQDAFRFLGDRLLQNIEEMEP